MRLYTVEECPRPGFIAGLYYKAAAILVSCAFWAAAIYLIGRAL